MAGNAKFTSVGSSGTTTLQTNESADRTLNLPDKSDTIITRTLDAGTTSQAPLLYVAGTNLTTPAVGATEFDGLAFYNTADATTGRRVNDSFQFFKLTAAGSAISTIADFFGTNDGIPLLAGGIYEIEWHCYFIVATGGTSTWTLTNTGTLTNLVANWNATPIAGFGTQGASTSAGILASTTTTQALPVSGSLTAANHYHKITAFIEQNGAGNVRLRQTMSAGTSTPQRDSYFRVRQHPAGNVGIFVA
jgi:hypothetical protein